MAEPLRFGHFPCVPSEARLVDVGLEVLVAHVVVAARNHTAEVAPEALDVVGVDRPVVLAHELQRPVAAHLVRVAHF